LGDVSVNGKIVFKWMLKKQGVRVWITFARVRIGYSGGLL
jgi:hypothetical protein